MQTSKYASFKTHPFMSKAHPFTSRGEKQSRQCAGQHYSVGHRRVMLLCLTFKDGMNSSRWWGGEKDPKAQARISDYPSLPILTLNIQCILAFFIFCGSSLKTRCRSLHIIRHTRLHSKMPPVLVHSLSLHPECIPCFSPSLQSNPPCLPSSEEPGF